MIYPESFENKIGFDKIRNLIKAKCKGSKGKHYVDALSFTNNVLVIKEELAKTAEMIDISRLKEDYPIVFYPETDPVIKKLNIENSCLEASDLSNIRIILETLKSINYFFKKHGKESYPILSKKVFALNFPIFVLDRINAVLTKNGEVKDNASPKLKEIRNSLNSLNRSVLSKTEAILSKIRSNGWIDKELSATLVNGRMVLPIESTHKRKIKGLIHDESASGKTSYIEPQEIVEINNQIREFELEEKREVYRILIELTEDIRPYADNLSEIDTLVGELDFLYAKSLFATEIQAIIPAVESNQGIDIVRGQHPLLYLNLKKENKKLVPLSFKIDNDNRILVISGPNAGGKSVALKTAALICYMVQCGLPIPVGGTSVIGIFDSIFIDLGDDQSIDNDLSTYSSHLQNMKYFLKNSNENTLILIDEFGSGTDPIIGGTIAESILEELNNKKVFGVITTHYSNLKIFASNTDGIQNAAMMIDNNKMEPLFILEQGFPGSSYALEIASRSGLPENIINNAKEKAGQDKADFDKFMRKVLKDKRYWERKRLNIRKKEKTLEEILEKSSSELENLLKTRKKIIEEAKNEANSILKSVNKQIENTIREIKESKADKEKTQIARKNLESFKGNFDKEISTKEKDKLDSKYQQIKKKQEEKAKKNKEKKQVFVKVDDKEVHIGSKARIIGQDTIGEVVDIGEKTVVICFGNIYTTISKDKVEKVSKSEEKDRKKPTRDNTAFNKKLMDFKPYIDIRGQRVDEALKSITDFIDEGIMFNFNELKILHGKGDGILREQVRNYLKTFPQVKKAYSEDVRFGGDGITIIELQK